VFLLSEADWESVVIRTSRHVPDDKYAAARHDKRRGAVINYHERGRTERHKAIPTTPPPRRGISLHQVRRKELASRNVLVNAVVGLFERSLTTDVSPEAGSTS